MGSNFIKFKIIVKSQNLYNLAFINLFLFFIFIYVLAYTPGTRSPAGRILLHVGTGTFGSNCDMMPCIEALGPAPITNHVVGG